MNLKSVYLIACLATLVACGGGGGGGTSSTQPTLTFGQQGVIYFNSVNAKNFKELVTKTYDPTPVSIYGTLLLPADLSKKVPAMVIAHGTGGVTAGREFEWAQYLNTLGIAGFVVDSFTPRGIGTGGIDPNTVNSSINVADALVALELLSTHPNIDANRIGVMGGSRGGNVAYITAFEEARKGIISGTLKFAAHIPLYPNCNLRKWSPNMTGSPMLFLLAELDDMQPAAACSDFSQSLATQVPDITTIVYKGAYHGFDSNVALEYLANTPAYGGCAGEERLDISGPTRFRRYDTNQVFSSGADYTSYVNGCVTLGAHFGAIDQTAEDQAKIDVSNFLKTVFNL